MSDIERKLLWVLVGFNLGQILAAILNALLT